MSDGLALTLAGIGIMLAVPATFFFANWVRKNVDHGEARFDSAGKVIRAEPERPQGPAQPAQRLSEKDPSTGADDHE